MPPTDGLSPCRCSSYWPMLVVSRRGLEETTALCIRYRLPRPSSPRPSAAGAAIVSPRAPSPNIDQDEVRLSPCAPRRSPGLYSSEAPHPCAISDQEVLTRQETM